MRKSRVVNSDKPPPHDPPISAAMVAKWWGVLVSHITSFIATPMFRGEDDDITRYRKKIFSWASATYIIEDIAIVATVFASDGLEGTNVCAGYLGFTAIAGFLLTLGLYTYGRIQQACNDSLVALQFLQASVQQFVFAIFLTSANACIGAVGIIAASLLYAACRVPLMYHVLPSAVSVGIFASSIADVVFHSGASAKVCEHIADAPAPYLIPVAVIMLVQFYSIVAMTSVSTFVVSLYGDDMRGFFSLRMSNVVLGLIAGLNFETAAKVLDVCRDDVAPDLHGHFHSILSSMQRYKGYVPSSLFRADGHGHGSNEASLQTSPANLHNRLSNSSQPEMDDAEPPRAQRLSAGGVASLVAHSNPLVPVSQRASVVVRSEVSEANSSHNTDVGPTAMDVATGHVIAKLFSDHSAPDSVGLLRNFQIQRCFEAKSATVLRLSFSQGCVHEGNTFRSAMSEVVTTCEQYFGEIEEATSTFVLISFGVRFHLAHEQVAVDCAVALYHSLTQSIFHPHMLYISIVTGEITWGTYVTEEKSFVVIGGPPVDLAAKLNTLQEQLKAPVVSITDTVSHCRNHFVAADLCRPSGFVRPFQVFELAFYEVTDEVKGVMSEVLGMLSRGPGMMHAAVCLLQTIEHLCPQAQRLSRVLSALPPEVEYYCKDEVPWVSNSDEVIEAHPVFQGAFLSAANGAGHSQGVGPDGQPSSLVESCMLAVSPTGALMNDTSSFCSMASYRHGAASQHGLEEDDEDFDGNERDSVALQRWTLGPVLSSGNTCRLSLALGALGTLAAAVRYNQFSDVRELFSLSGSGKMVHRNVARLYTVIPAADHSDEELLVTEYFPQGSLKRFLQDYIGATIGPMTWVNYVREMLRGAHLLSAWKIVHGCIRPSCVMLGDDSRCVLVKYGLVPPHKGHPDHMFYAAPELVLLDSNKRGRSDVDVLSPALDVWSIGITALELIGCRNPIRVLCDNDPAKCLALFSPRNGISQKKLSKHVREEMRGAPSSMIDFVLQCIVMEPSDRIAIQDAAQMMDGISITSMSFGGGGAHNDDVE